MKHSWSGLIYLIAATSAFAVMPPKHDPLPNYDRRMEKPARAPAVTEAAHIAATARLAGQVPNIKVTRDEITGTPRVISRAGGFLTGPKAQGLSVRAQALRGLEQDSHRAVKAFINEHASLFGQDASILDGARIKREFVTAHNGMRTVIWEQLVDDIPVFEGLLTSHITKNEELVTLSSHFIPNSAQAAAAGSGKQAIDRAKPRLTAVEAIVKAAADLSVNITAADVAAHYQPGEERPGVSHYTAPGLNGTTEASLVWLPLDGKKLRLCWQIILTSRARGEMYRVLVDADDATPLLRHSLTSYISDATYRVYTSDSPSPFSPSHSVPSTNQPPTVARTLVTLPALNTNASPAGWINDGVNETRGNNVDAHLDRDANDSPDLPRPQGSPNRVFDFPMNLAQAPSSYTNAAVTQLFYWNNWMHDKLYELGFTEAAGNFQVNNFGRGGLGNDAVSADAQDGAGVNNANMLTPPDGSSPRMQMFLFDGPNPDRDGDFDAEVVLHEYTHGLSNRRVGGGVGISTLQAAGMGEGWSDFYALALLSESTDNIHGNYAAGGYLTLNFFGLQENYYFGIRRYPYSTDMSKNPLTFKDIDPSQADPHSGIPMSPIGGGPANQVHNQGEVWCVALWDARANLIEKHGFAVGNQLILQLVTDGMNLSPANPNFLEARDGIIQADLVLTGGANFHELWRAFAKRGMGFNATSPASTTTFGIVESFDVPDDLLVLPSGPLLVIGPVGGPFTPSSQTYVLTNVSTNNVIWVAQNSAPWLQLSSTSGSIAPGDPSATVAAIISPGADLLPLGVYTDQITFSNQVSGRTQSRPVTLAVGEPDHLTEQFQGDNDLDFSMFTFTPDGSASYYSVCREAASAFPVEPRDGKTISLSDDTFIMMQLAGGARIKLFGRSTNIFFIGSNGYLTLDFGDSSLSELLSGYFSLPRVAALMTDLNPAAGGSVTWQQMGDRAVVSFVNVPLFGSSATTNSFQIEMFYDGRIRITYLAVSYVGGIAGLSRGEGQPFAFRESDFSAYPSCSARFTVGFPPAVTEGQGIVEGTVSIPFPALSNIVASLRSSNPAELSVPDTVKISTGETNVTFVATVVDDALVDGSQSVAITAAKSGFTSDNAATTVHDNEQTQLALILPASVLEGGTAEGIVNVGQTVDANVTVFLNAAGPSLLLPATVTIPSGTNSASLTLFVPDNSRIDGNRLEGVSAYVQNWMAATGSVEVLDNELTELSVVMPATASESAGTLTNVGLVTIPGTLATNLTVALSASGPLTIPPSVMIPAGQRSNRFNVTLVDDALATGDRQALVTASAFGWSGDQASVTVIDDEYPPQPILPSPAHLSSNNPVTIDLSWRAGDGEVLGNGGFETGDLPPWTRSLPLGVGWVINTSSFDPNSPDGPLPPFSGNFSVITVQSGPGIHELRQQVSLPGGSATLTWAHRIRNHAGVFEDNQVFRVEIRDQSGVLAVAFSTQPGDAALQEWTEHSFDLTPFAGREIEIVFYERDELGFFNAHVDAVSILSSSPQVTTYDVYFGTNANLGPANFVGSTTNLTWELPNLAALTTYYWQIIARRVGAATGPIWQFTTRGVDSFVWDAIASPQMANASFPAAIVAQDELGRPVTNFSGTVSLSRISDGVTNPLSPATITDFINGRWSGTVTISEPLAQVTLLAQDTEGRSGLSGPFSVTAADDVSIAVNSTPNPVMAQRPLWLTLTAHNSGPSAANGVLVSNVLPATFTFVSAVPSQGSCSNSAGTVVCNLGSLAGGQTATIAINVTPTGAGPATNGTTITRAEVDAALSNNSAQHVITVLPFVTMALGPLSTNEGVGEFAIELRLNRPTGAPITFGFRLESGSATASLDFNPTNGVVVIPAGVTNQLLVLHLVDDAMHETNETFALVITNAVNASPQLTRYTLTILDDDLPPAFSIADASVIEGNAGTSEAHFTVQLSSASGTAARVNYNTTAGLAGAGTDFVMTNGTIQIPPGATNGQIIVLVRGDLLDENSETFNVNLFGPTNATVADSLALGSIIDDDAPPSLRVLDANFVEGSANNTQFVTVELSAPSGLSVIVGYATSNGTAIAGSDFLTAAGTLGFSAGTVSRTIPITVLGDTNNEGVERFSVALSNATGASIADGMAAVTLLNDDAPPGTLDHFVWSAIPTPQHLNMPFAVTLLARDFFGNPATNFTGTAGLSAESAGFSIGITPTVSGVFVGGVWTGSVSVLEPATSVRLIAMTSAEHTGTSNPFDVVATNDVVLTMSATPNPVTVADTLTFELVVTNTGPDTASSLVISNTLPQGVQFVAVNATSGSCSNSGNLVICDLGSLPGSSRVAVAIQVSPQVTGSLTNAAIIQPAGSDAYLPNNAAMAIATVLPSPSISVANISVTETDTGSTNARFVISLSHVSSRDVSARFATVPGSAGPLDFVAANGVVVIVAGNTSAIVEVVILGDLLDEANETFLLELSHATNGVIVTGTASAQIQDQDPAPQLSIADTTVSEGNPPDSPVATFVVSLSRPSALPVSVRAGTQNSTAVAGVDYVATNAVIFFAPGATNATFDVSVLPDLLDENDETLLVNLSNPTNAALVDVRAAGIVVDDDSLPVITASELSVAEGDSGFTTGRVHLALSQPSGRTVSVQFSFLDGTAARGSDFSGANGTMVFSAGTTNVSLPITINGDSIIEETEDFFVNFFSPSNAAMPTPFIRALIVNDDGLPGALDSFSWAAIGSPRRANTPFSATVFARDRFGDLATGFAGPASLRARIAQPEIEIGAGNVSWHYPLASFFHDARCQVIYLANELMGPRQIAGLALNVDALPGQALNNWTIRLKHTTRSNYVGVSTWESTGWTTVYRRAQAIAETGWLSFPFSNVFNYNGSNHLMIDFSFDNTSFTFDGNCLATLTSQPRAMTGRSDSANGDPIVWAATPVPVASSRIPNIRFQPVSAALPMTPSNTGPFNAGIWTGNVTLQVPGTNVQLIAEDSSGRIGFSAPFDVRPANTPLILQITRTETAVQLLWESIVGRAYRVDYAEVLDSQSWEPLGGTIVGVGPTSVVSDSLAPNAQRFYRVVELP